MNVVALDNKISKRTAQKGEVSSGKFLVSVYLKIKVHKQKKHQQDFVHHCITSFRSFLVHNVFVDSAKVRKERINHQEIITHFGINNSAHNLDRIRQLCNFSFRK